MAGFFIFILIQKCIFLFSLLSKRFFAFFALEQLSHTPPLAPSLATMPVQSVPAATATALGKEKRQQRALIAQLTPLVIIDQGGGSFTGHFFPSGKKVKSKKLADTMRQTEVQDIVLETTGCHILAEDNTIADFSHVAAEHYPLIAQWFVTYWLLAGCLTKAHMIIRQTGKIRAKLHTPGNEELLKEWNEAMEATLTTIGFPNADYALLSNKEEARLEGECFFRHKCNLDFFEEHQLTEVVGAGIGSSSTQFYVLNGTAFDSKLGSKPTKHEQEEIAAGKVKSAEDFEDGFKALFERLHDQGATLHGASFIATNAIGYCAAALGKVLGENNAFSVMVKTGLPVSTDCYLREVKRCISVNGPSWDANIILGMLNACKEVGISHVVMEQKRDHGDGLPIEISWTTALAHAHFEKQNSAPALPATSGVGGGAPAAAAAE